MNEKSKGSDSSAWDSYWFHPSPLFNLALCRIIIVGYQIYSLISRDYWGNVLTRQNIPALDFNPLPVFQFLNYPLPWRAPPTFFLILVLIVAFAACLTSLVGLKTRRSLFVCAVSNLYIQTYLYSFGQFHHGEAILLIALFLFALAPSGGAISIDNLRRCTRAKVEEDYFEPFNALRGESLYARWPLLIIQWLFSLIYLSAALNKINQDGPGLLSGEWMNGYTLQYYLIRDGLQWGSDLGVWLGHFHLPAIIFSWFSVLFEGTFFLVIPFPQLIWLYIPLGIFLHIGIWVAQRAPFFNYLAVYSVFVPWTAVIKIVSNRLKWNVESRKTELFYDGVSEKFVYLLTVLCYFDWFQRITYSDLQLHEPIPSEKRREIGLKGRRSEDFFCIEPDGNVKKGFFALRRVMTYLPPLWPLLLIMYIPGMNVVGHKLYLVVTARSRARAAVAK